MSLNKINFDCTRVYDNKTNKTNYVCNPSRNIENFQITTTPVITATTAPPTFPQKQMVCINNVRNMGDISCLKNKVSIFPNTKK